MTRLRLIPLGLLLPELIDSTCAANLPARPHSIAGHPCSSIRTDWQTGTFAGDPQLVAVLRGSDSTVHVERRNKSWWSGFGSVFRLGMRHIAEGADHLLFLLALLLPAPLLVARGRWTGYSDARRCLVKICRVVTAFTAGHSVSLAAGVMNLAHVPGRPIEVLIAFSILVSALHALRPIFPGREAIVGAASVSCMVWRSPLRCRNSVSVAGRELRASSRSISESRPCSSSSWRRRCPRCSFSAERVCIRRSEPAVRCLPASPPQDGSRSGFGACAIRPTLW